MAEAGVEGLEHGVALASAGGLPVAVAATRGIGVPARYGRAPSGVAASWSGCR